MKVANASHTSVRERDTVSAFAEQPSTSRAQVVPVKSMIEGSKPFRVRRVTRIQFVGALFNWLLWLLITLVVLSQFLGMLWDTLSSDQYVAYGASPLEGPSQIPGSNDEPYSDRSVVCVMQGRTFLPLSVNDALALKTTKLTDTTDSAINGYRVVNRTAFTLSTDARAIYAHTCSVIASTLDALFQRCTLLGYNITRDNLRVVGNLESSKMYLIKNSLPVLLMPFWDNCNLGRFVIPGLDGSACMFRLLGKYSDPASAVPYAIAVNRTTREAKTVEWLNRPGGAWRNGWYEDLQGEKWHSDVISDEKDSTLGIQLSQFNMLTGKMIVCDDPIKCTAAFLQSWGSKFFYGNRIESRSSIIISNGRRYGMFLYKAHLLNLTRVSYDWETLVFNVVAFRILYRWFQVMVTLQRGYFLGVSKWHNAGIGCLASFRSFDYLPLLLLPRLKMTLFAFWSTGCEFVGAQLAFASAWFVMYPAIVQVVLLYYSILNLVAKFFRLRVSDAMFGPNVIFFFALHWFRQSLSRSGWLETDDSVPSLMTASEFNKASLVEFFTSDLALRTGGNLKSIVFIKVVVFTVSLLPFLWSVFCATVDRHSTTEPMSRVENALAIRISNAGGLGAALSPRRIGQVRVDGAGPTLSISDTLSSYEVVRLGYLVFGDVTSSNDSYLVTFDDWDFLTLLTPVRRLAHLWNHRVKVYALKMKHGVTPIATEPEMLHVDDARLQQILWWKVSSRAIE